MICLLYINCCDQFNNNVQQQQNIAPINKIQVDVKKKISPSQFNLWFRVIYGAES